MPRLSFLLAATTVIFLCTTTVAPKPVYACSCAVEAGVTQQELAEEAFAQSTAVFAGEVTNIEDPPPSSVVSSADPVTVTFAVSEAWKGVRAETVEITTPMSSASCGYEFRDGEEYLVYAPENMEVWLCGETKPLSDAAANLETLETVNILPDTSGVEAPNYPVLPNALGIAGLAATLAASMFIFVFLGRPSRRF